MSAGYHVSLFTSRIKPWLIAVTALLLVPSLAVAQIAFVQDDHLTSSAVTSHAIPFSASVSAGNAILVCSGPNINADVSNVTDTLGNTYQEAVALGGDRRAEIWYALNSPAGANTVTVTFATSTDPQTTILEYSGIATSNALDQTNSNSNPSGTAHSAGSITTTVADDLVVACYRLSSSQTVSATETGYIERQGGTRLKVVDQVLPGTATTDADITVSSSTISTAVIASFKKAVAITTLPVGAISPAPRTETVRVIEIDANQAAISWTTDRPSYSKLEYGTSTASYTKEFSLNPSTSRVSHSAVLDGLEPRTTYYFRIVSGRSPEERVTSYEYSFTTEAAPDVVPPPPVQRLIGIPGFRSVTLAWLNPAADPDWARTVVVRRTDRSPSHLGDGELVFTGTWNFTRDEGLLNGTPHYYAVFTVDGSSNASRPVTAILSPQAELQEAPMPPPGRALPSLVTAALQVTDLTATSTSGHVSLRWKNPDASSFLGIQIVRKRDSSPTHPFDGEVAFVGRAARYDDIGLDPDTRYFYGVFAFDWDGTFSAGAFLYRRTEPTKEDVERLKALIEKAQQLVREVQTALGSRPASEGEIGAVPRFARTLRFGMSGDDVRALQELLARDPDVYPEGTVSGYFGPLTRNAVRRFQVKHDIVSSGDELTTGFGQVGPRTRAQLDASAR